MIFGVYMVAIAVGLFEIVWPAAVLILLVPSMRSWTRQHAERVGMPSASGDNS